MRTRPGENNEEPPEIIRGHTEDVHEYVVEQVRDVTRGGKIVLEIGGPRVDTAFRQLFPVTYDIVIEHPEDKTTGEDK
ncbi:hypothetical protein ACFY05_13085 [Microtetraspora fusca]|uniref:Uncharacterized protein n=1 Tax=Microtetraspora fusca TaxID=1997 RepID=A0ABW6V3H9_MICFU